MITAEGKQHLKRYLSGQVNTLAQSMSFGVGNAAESSSDERMQFEIARSDIHLSTYDYVAEKIIFKATIPDYLAGKIYEVSLWSLSADNVSGAYSSRLITSFDSATEIWTGGTFTSVNNRIGIDALTLSPAAGTTTEAYLNEIGFDLSGYSAADQFTIAYYGGANISGASVRFLTDASNYYQFNFTPAAGYNVAVMNKGSALVTGSPDWGNITSITVYGTATAGGTGSIEFDGIRIEDADSINADYVMISRDVITVPVVKEQSREMDVEFSLGVTV